MTNYEQLMQAALAEKTSEPGDPLRRMAELLLDFAMEAEVSAKRGAEAHERSDERTGYRNGHRERRWDTRLGTLQLQVPKVRQGGYVPSFIEHRKRSEQALISVIQQAVVQGVSTRKVESVLEALGIEGVSAGQVSQLCSALDEQVERFRERKLDQSRYVWVDALYEKVREDGRVESMAVVIATGVNAQGRREVLGMDVFPTESEEGWTQFLKDLKARGLKGVQLVISDAHEGLKSAIRKVFKAEWQRCKVHFYRNVLVHVPKRSQAEVSEAMKAIFVQRDEKSAKAKAAEVVKQFQARFSKAMETLEAGVDDVLSYLHYPAAHRVRISSTNPIERLNLEVRRRTRVVGIFPDRAACVRLIAMVLEEIHEDWLTAEKAYLTFEDQAGGQEADTGKVVPMAANQ
ncbi:MAG: IS256 family transposase [Bryobacterales bacterium]|nr:IS256 family transposase [Bryobacterales bacterium]